MKELLLFVIKSIVKYPEDVEVEERPEEKQTIIDVKVNPKDVGLIIGKKGIVAHALKDLVKIKGVGVGKYYYLNLITPPKEEGPGTTQV